MSQAASNQLTASEAPCPGSLSSHLAVRAAAAATGDDRVMFTAMEREHSPPALDLEKHVLLFSRMLGELDSLS